MNIKQGQTVLRSFACAIGILLLLLPCAPEAFSQFDADLEARVKDFALQRYNGFPYNEGKQFNANALPVLTDLLNDPANEYYYSTIVQTIGVIGDEKGMDILTDFLVNRFKGEVNLDQDRALYMVNIAIGHIAAHGSKRAFDYLAEGTKEETWINKSLRWQYEGTPGYREAVKSAIAGLGVTGSNEAEKVLLQLRSSQTYNDKNYRGSIDGNLDFIERVRRRGGYEEFNKDPYMACPPRTRPEAELYSGLN